MGGIYKAGFERCVQAGGLANLGDFRRGLTNDGDSAFGYTFVVTSGSLSNPATEAQSDWNQNGSRLQTDGYIWGIWDSDADQAVGELDIEVSDGAGGWDPFAVIDGNQLPESVVVGTQVTLEVGSSEGSLDFVRPGLTSIVFNGITGVTAYYVLLDNGSPIGGGATINEGGAGPTWSYNSGSTQFEAGSDATFNNSSGGSWNVTAIEVREGSETGNTIMRDTVSATVPDGASITFTSIVQNITNLL